MRKFLLKLLTGASLTASVFVFQACYGTPVPEVYDLPRNQVEVNPDEAKVNPDEAEVPEIPEIPEDIPAQD